MAGPSLLLMGHCILFLAFLWVFLLGLRDMVLLFLPLFLSPFFLSLGLIWAFLPLGPCYQKWVLILCIPLYNIIVLHTCMLPFLMISLAIGEILQLCYQNYFLTLVSCFSIKNQVFKNSFFFFFPKQLCFQNPVSKLIS